MASVLSKLFLLSASVTPALAFCGSHTHVDRRLARRQAGGEETVEVNDFGYTGLQGPLNWAQLAPENTACSSGNQQSPIDMVEGQFQTVPGNSINLAIPDAPQGATFENLGTTVEVIMEGGSITMQGQTFNLAQFHFHHPSEHLDAGTSMPSE